MYFETKTKFYEIVKKKNNIYIHYGKIPSINIQLPFGTFLMF